MLLVRTDSAWEEQGTMISTRIQMRQDQVGMGHKCGHLGIPSPDPRRSSKEEIVFANPVPATPSRQSPSVSNTGGIKQIAILSTESGTVRLWEEKGPALGHTEAVAEPGCEVAVLAPSPELWACW